MKKISAFKPYIKPKMEYKFKNYTEIIKFIDDKFKLKESEKYQCHLFANQIIIYKIKKIKVL